MSVNCTINLGRFLDRVGPQGTRLVIIGLRHDVSATIECPESLLHSVRSAEGFGSGDMLGQLRALRSEVSGREGGTAVAVVPTIRLGPYSSQQLAGTAEFVLWVKHGRSGLELVADVARFTGTSLIGFEVKGQGIPQVKPAEDRADVPAYALRALAEALGLTEAPGSLAPVLYEIEKLRLEVRHREVRVM